MAQKGEGLMFGWTRIATLVAVAAALAMATGVAGATSKPGSVPAAGSHTASAGKISTAAAARAALLKTANLRTRAGAARYLRSIGLNARHFVIQRGIRNYAGAKCPGAGWSCTSTAHPVIQIASAGGSNTFQCATSSCAVVQVSLAASSNKGTCIKTTGLSQSCSISQTSTTANNVAIVVENTSKMSGLTQTALVTAQITQKASSGANTACVNQNITVDGSNGIGKKGTPVSVNLDAHQSISIAQDSATGANTVGNATQAGACDEANPLMQSQTLTSGITGSASITQNENAVASNPASCLDSGPNVCLDIKQNRSVGFLGSATGVNTSAFVQTNSLTAIASTTPTGPVSQTQSSPTGGLLATVNQFSHGMSTSHATQTETQCEHAQTSGVPDTNNCLTTAPQVTPLSQVQYGPLRKGAGPSTQGDFGADVFTVNQTSTQKNDIGNPSNNQSNTMQADCTTSGTCTATQNTNINGTPSTNTESGSSVDTQTTCSGSSCTSTGPTTTSTLTISPTGLSVSNTDVAEFGVGGMRGTGTGSITTNGITGPVAHAFLFWHGPTNSANPASNASVTFNGTPITGTNIGTASDNNWGFQNSQSYRADVTSLVTGNATYSLSDFLKADADINGVSLIVFYDDGNSSNDRNVVAWNGNDSNVAFGADPADWNETISGVPYPGSGTATLDLVVSDGQSYADADVVLNGNTGDPVAAGPSIFQGDSGPNYSGNPSGVTGSLWDVKSFDITRFLVSGSNTLNLTSGTAGDALSLVVAIANVPASAPVIG
jgi:hypothetical protein